MVTPRSSESMSTPDHSNSFQLFPGKQILALICLDNSDEKSGSHTIQFHSPCLPHTYTGYIVLSESIAFGLLT